LAKRFGRFERREVLRDTFPGVVRCRQGTLQRTKEGAKRWDGIEGSVGRGREGCRDALNETDETSLINRGVKGH